MSNAVSFREELISQIPALQLLMAMGYAYLTPDDALANLSLAAEFRNVIWKMCWSGWLHVSITASSYKAGNRHSATNIFNKPSAF
jgi:hypothetical protein